MQLESLDQSEYIGVHHSLADASDGQCLSLELKAAPEALDLSI